MVTIPVNYIPVEYLQGAILFGGVVFAFFTIFYIIALFQSNKLIRMKNFLLDIGQLEEYEKEVILQDDLKHKLNNHRVFSIVDSKKPKVK